MLSAGPAERAIRNSSMERARDVVANAIALYRRPSGEYHLNNKFHYLIARKMNSINNTIQADLRQGTSIDTRSL
jgi:hypothetical protein